MTVTGGSQEATVRFEGHVMKKVILAVLLTAAVLFLILPNLSWAF